MAAPIDDDDEPVGPRRMADDERPADAQLKTAVAAELAVPPVSLSNDIELRKLMLEEMRFHLEERKELHKMGLEIRHEEQREDEISYERAQVAKEEAKKKKDLKTFEKNFQILELTHNMRI